MALAPPQIVTLSNGRYSVRLSEAGSGYARLEAILPLPDGVAMKSPKSDGFHLYLRDLDDGFMWSAGYQPTRVVPSRYEFRAVQNVAEISRVDRDIECRMQVFVVPRHDVEIRLLQLANHGETKRRIEVTSYLEWVLGSQDGDANHPAFSKLFVETQYCEKRRAVLARRRPRSNDDSEMWGVHCGRWRMSCQAKLEFETNRMRFIGRGRTLARSAGDGSRREVERRQRGGARSRLLVCG